MTHRGAHVGICLPCDLADALVGAQGCNCPQAITFLMRIGAPMAAQMHAAEAEKSTTEWTARDWMCHMAEEEERLFPLLPPMVAEKLRKDHDRFRMELSIYGDIKSVTLLGMHFDAEETWCQSLMDVEPLGLGSDASVSGTDATGKPPWQFAATLAIGFGLAMLAMRLFRAK